MNEGEREIRSVVGEGAAMRAPSSHREESDNFADYKNTRPSTAARWDRADRSCSIMVWLLARGR